MELRNLRLRFSIASVIIFTTFIYFQFLSFLPAELSLVLYCGMVAFSTFVALVTRRLDITYGILYGLSLVFLVMLIVFTVYPENLPLK
ncbi:MAG: hypothetical protein ACK40G_08265 [Cytophagaceae bacterium]